MKRNFIIVMLIMAFIAGETVVTAKTTKKTTKTSQSSHKKSSSSRGSNGSDLAIFNVQGNVKSITYHGNRNYCAPSPFYYGKPILFSEKGDCTNLSEILQVTMDSRRRVKIKRNSLGELDYINNSDDYGEDGGGSVSFEWKDGRVSRFASYEVIGSDENTMTLEYANGRISGMEGGGCRDGICHTTKVSFTNFKVDSHGNWTECNMTIDQEIGDFDEVYDTIHETFYIQRTITYYD